MEVPGNPLTEAPTRYWMCPQCLGMHGVALDDTVDDAEDVGADENPDVREEVFIGAYTRTS